MFTLHFLAKDKKWSVAVGPNIPGLIDYQKTDFVVVRETENTARLTKILKTFHEDTSRILGVLTMLLNSEIKLVTMEDVRKAIAELNNEDSKRVQSIFGLLSQDKQLIIKAFREVILSKPTSP